MTLLKILAAEASQLPEVQHFRETCLGGKLLAPEDVPGWIEQHKGEGGHRVTVEAPFMPDDPFDWFTALSAIPAEERKKRLIKWEIDTLEYPKPKETWVHQVPVPKDGPLRHLKQVAARLTRRYPWWQEAQAVAFVLAGLFPLLPKARATLHYYSHTPPRITLELDPRLSSQEAAALYAKVRSQVFRGKDRPMTEKHLRLAVFLAEEEAAAWPELMRRWNRKHPEWQYPDHWWFYRDATAAFKRVTGRKWTPQQERR